MSGNVLSAIRIDCTGAAPTCKKTCRSNIWMLVPRLPEQASAEPSKIGSLPYSSTVRRCGIAEIRSISGRLFPDPNRLTRAHENLFALLPAAVRRDADGMGGKDCVSQFAAHFHARRHIPDRQSAAAPSLRESSRNPPCGGRGPRPVLRYPCKYPRCIAGLSRAAARLEI